MKRDYVLDKGRRSRPAVLARRLVYRPEAPPSSGKTRIRPLLASRLPRPAWRALALHARCGVAFNSWTPQRFLLRLRVSYFPEPL
jgi:hypothetical protein